MTFSLSISRSGDRTLLVRRADGRTVHIHSSYDPQWEAERTVEQLPADGRRGYIVCGAGLGYHIRRLLEVCPPQSLVFVIEPTARDSFRPLICQVFAADRWWQDRRLVWLVGPGLRELASIINKRAQTDGIRQLTLLQYFPVVCLYREFYDRFTASVFAKTEELMNLDYDYRRKAQIETFVNAWDNLPAIAAAPPIDGWRGRAAGRRAVVVGGGPSLDLDIEQLAASRDQFLVIAAGSAIGALHRAGIAPDFLVVVDPFAVNVGEVSQFLSDEVVLVVPYTAPRRLVAGHGGMTLFFRTPETSPAANVLDCVADNLPPAAELMASASVVVTAVDWALFLGCSDIALLGVDMAFPDGKSHATGVMAADYPTAGGQDGREAITVEGWQGEKIPSSTVFRELLHFFAEWFTIFSVKVVNCSRLGAKIDGIDNIRFEQWLAAIGAGDRLPRLPVPPAGDGWAVDGLERQRQPAILDGIDGVLGQLRVEMEGVVAVQSREQAEQMAGRIRGLPGYQAVKPLLELEWEIFFLTVASGELVGGEDVRHLLIRMEELCRLAQQVIGGSRLSQPKTVNTGAG